MRNLIIQLFGVYTPVTTTEVITITDAEGIPQAISNTVVAAGAAGVDWAWIAGVVLFGIVLYSFFRLVGVFFK